LLRFARNDEVKKKLQVTSRKYFGSPALHKAILRQSVGNLLYAKQFSGKVSRTCLMQSNSPAKCREPVRIHVVNAPVVRSQRRPSFSRNVARRSIATSPVVQSQRRPSFSRNVARRSRREPVRCSLQYCRGVAGRSPAEGEAEARRQGG
jgi:hypothetical protein